jgi:PAS domain-containing protein
MDSFFGLLNNAALMMVLCVIYDTFGIYAITKKYLQYCITGALVGFIGIIVMLTPWSLQPGVFFDTRWVLLSLCGLFFGLTPTAIAVIITGSFRLYQGGPGGIVGTVVIVVTACVGLAWKYWNTKHDKPLGWKQLYTFGILVQLAMLSCMFLMPANMRIPIFKSVALPILIIYPVLTMFIGLVLKRQEDRRNAEKELIENRKALSNERGLLRGVINSIPDLIFFKNTDGAYLGCNKPFESFVESEEQSLLGKTDFDVFDKGTAEFLLKEDNHMFAIKKSVSNEKWVNYPDGKKVLLDTLKTPFKDLDGTIQGLIGIKKLITPLTLPYFAQTDLFQS